MVILSINYSLIMVKNNGKKVQPGDSLIMYPLKLKIMYPLKSKFNLFMRPFIAGLLLICLQNTAFGVEIVRLNLNYNNAPHTIDIELFDTVTPLTVNNFVNYVNSGKYDGSFFNRAVAGFIIQAGGFTFRPATPTSPLEPVANNSGLANVPLESSSPVKNEFALTSLTNVRGTLAMAKLPHNPDSASDEWFINLADNRVNLDNQNGGFTVFGRVIDDGMVTADKISNFPIQTFAGSILGSAFSALPVVNYTLYTSVLKKNLVMITSASSSIVRPILRFTPGFTPDGNNFPLAVAGNSSGKLQVFTFTNTGNEALIVDPIVNTLVSPSPFTLEADTCSNATLAPVSVNPAASCQLKIRFTAITAATVADSLALSYSGLSGNYHVTLELKAEGIPATAVLSLNRTSVGFLPTDQGGTDTQKLMLRNKGGGALTLNNIVSSNADFSFDTIGCAAGTVLTAGQSCELTLSFTPSSIANSFHPNGSNITGNLTIATSASNVTVPLSGAGVDPTISTPSPVNFNNVLSGQSAAQGVSIQNTGLTGLLIDTITFTGPDAALFSYRTDCPSGIMKAAASCTIGVTFKPNSNGVKNATLVVNSNDATHPQVNIALTGKGIIATTPVLNASGNSLIFGSHVVDGTTLNHSLILDNIGAGIITINSISIIGANASLFGFDSAGCRAGTTLNSCNLKVSFTPVSNGSFSANLFVQTTAGNLTIPLSGTGTASSIAAPKTIDVGVSQVNGLDAKQGFFIGNAGASKLSVSNISITGVDKNAFKLNNLCPATAPDAITLNPAKQCQIGITLSSLTLGNKTANIILTTNDPVNSSYTIHLTGVTDTDVDGVPASIERQAPNNGDGNNDGIADAIENNVASFVAGSNKRITLVSNIAKLSKTATILNGVKVLSKLPGAFPKDKFFDIGAYSFTIRLSVVGDGVDVGVYLPLDVKVDKFYRFGPTPNNPTPHLYDFTFNSKTGVGAKILGPVTVRSKFGKSIKVNFVLISYIDGKLGDDDLTANGAIVNSAGGFSTPHAASSSSSGAMSIYYLLFFGFTGLLLRLATRSSRVLTP